MLYIVIDKCRHMCYNKKNYYCTGGYTMDIEIEVRITNYDASSTANNCSGGCSGCSGSCSCGSQCANPGSCGNK